MASPQSNNGHIDIANEIAEAMYKLQLSGNQWRILWVIFRQTYGWHKKQDKISFTFFENKTNLNRRHIARALNDMIERNIITKNGNDNICIYGLQKDYEKWKLLPKMVIVTKNGNSLLPKMVMPITKNGNETITKNGKHKRNLKETIQKKLIKETIKDKFKIFRQKYPGTKRGLNKEFEDFEKKNKKELSVIINLLTPALEHEIENKKALKQSGEFCPDWKHLKTWINQECWTQEFPEIEQKPKREMVY